MQLETDESDILVEDLARATPRRPNEEARANGARGARRAAEPVAVSDAERAAITERVRQQYMAHPFPPPQRRHSYRAHARYLRGFLGEVGLDPIGRRFADVACGSGLMLLDHALEMPQTTFVGYDLSPASVARANASFAEEGATNARAVVADMLELDVPETFDCVTCWGAVHHLADARAGVRTLGRLLRPGGVLRLGVYGYFGNWDRHLQQEVLATLAGNSDVTEQIAITRERARTDPTFQTVKTAPPVDLSDDAWVVDEFLHVWERPITLRQAVTWLEDAALDVVRVTDYDNTEIALDPALYLHSESLAARARRLPFADRCHLVDLLVRPYWLALLAVKR